MALAVALPPVEGCGRIWEPSMQAKWDLYVVVTPKCRAKAAAFALGSYGLIDGNVPVKSGECAGLLEELRPAGTRG